MQQSIVSFHKDDKDHWIAEIECGHFQHMRHNPPIVIFLWVLSEQGRESMLRYKLEYNNFEEGLTKNIWKIK